LIVIFGEMPGDLLLIRETQKGFRVILNAAQDLPIDICQELKVHPRLNAKNLCANLHFLFSPIGSVLAGS
jgi:hypothetical protein